MARAPYRKAAAVRADLVDATIGLLAERPSTEITVREIAARAGVQHSMITRHFGSKQALVAEAVASVASDYAAAVTSNDDVAGGFVQALHHLRSSPRTGIVLAARGADRVGGGAGEQFPGVASHLQGLLDAGADDDLRTRVLAGLLVSTVIGWSLGRDAVMDATGIAPERVDEVDRIADEIISALVASQLPEPHPG